MWRYVGGQNNEVEGVLVAKTLSYVALGKQDICYLVKSDGGP